MTPEPTFSSVVTATATLDALNSPLVPILLSILIVIAVALQGPTAEVLPLAM